MAVIRPQGGRGQGRWRKAAQGRALGVCECPWYMPKVFKLSGEPTQAQPTVSDTSLTLRRQLAQEFGDSVDRVWLVHGLVLLGFRLAHKQALLVELGDIRLQVIVLPTREAAVQLVLQQAVLPEVIPEDLIEHLGYIALESLHDLEVAIQLIFRNALARPDICDKYADLACSLKERCSRESPLADTEAEGARTFTRALLNTCQDEFDSVVALSEKHTLLAWVKLMGNLFLRQLVRRAQVVKVVVEELIGVEGGDQEHKAPEEYKIVSVCELLRTIGPTLDSTPQGKQAMTCFLARLVSLKRRRQLGPPDRPGGLCFSERVRAQIEHLTQLREFNWRPCC